MSESLTLDDIVEISRAFRFQWEPVQEAYVLLYPEGMIKLNDSAGEILRRVDGGSSIAEILKNLEAAFPGVALCQDVRDFMEIAYAKGWIKRQGD